MKRFSILIAALCLCLTGCGKQTTEATAQIFAMDTVMDLTAYGENAAAALTDASREINRLERLLSRTIDTSEISQINAGGAVTVSEETASLLAQAQTYTAATDGAFDITIAPLVSLWGITTDSPYVPTQQEIDALLPLVGSAHLHLSGDTATLDDGCAIDLGGIAKGYAADLLRAQLEKEGVTSATLDLGGDVFVMGRKTDGGDWRIAVKDPADTESYLGVVSAADKFIVTSGVYERYFEENGVRYHHILDPKTGCPAESGLVSVTVLCENGAWADALSTACFVLGPDGALALRDDLADQGADFELILVTDDGRVLYTDGLTDAFTPNDESGYTYEALA